MPSQLVNDMNVIMAYLLLTGVAIHHQIESIYRFYGIILVILIERIGQPHLFKTKIMLLLSGNIVTPCRTVIKEAIRSLTILFSPLTSFIGLPFVWVLHSLSEFPPSGFIRSPFVCHI